MMMITKALVTLSLALALTSAMDVVTFDGKKGTSFTFTELNDPVMGGRSTGTWDQSKGYGVFNGSVVNVPSLSAPGFIKASADGTFPDISSAAGGSILLKVRSSTSSYTGFRLSFASGTLSPAYACSGGGSIPLSRGCYKTKFAVPAGDDFATVRIPMSSFSDMWSPATGEHTKECSNDADVCPTADKLAGIKRFEVWAEGVKGDVHLELQSISAEAPSGAVTMLAEAEEVPARPPAAMDTCSGPVQANLLYGISEFTTSQYIPNETLATSVCCDARMAPMAEPQFLFQAPNVNLFSSMDSSGVTTFYDSVCGLPVFKAPIGRSFDAFKSDTNEHGWPSFRTEEIVAENIVTNRTSGGYVISKCGTHLGSYLPDDAGARWCIDLSCISGHAK